jgi:hypothetical protein
MTDRAIHATSQSPSPSTPGSSQDRACPAVPANLARLLYVVVTLLEFGRHLAATIERRSALPGFSLFAALFGTARLRVILAHLHRGILRASALETLLLKRAAVGRDVAITPPRIRTGAGAGVAAGVGTGAVGVGTGAVGVGIGAAGAGVGAGVGVGVGAAGAGIGAAAGGIGTDAAGSVAAAAGTDANAKTDPCDEPFDAQAAGRNVARTKYDVPIDPDYLPTREEIEAEVLCRPYGRTIAAICCDFGVVPGLCTRGFWDTLLEAIACHDGNVLTLWQSMHRKSEQYEREQALDAEQALEDEQAGCPQTFPLHSDAGLYPDQTLGFKIGEPPVDLFRDEPLPATPRHDDPVREATGPAAAEATGPPPHPDNGILLAA